ncbi:hypothetical protein ASG29_07890 [Sphingomonas sp. Leaf412]|uniref:hypothetical protein n=1 Tax=Sphingomonas sp. Leaf412 TaxID=1736370 RepID=UPI0006FF83A3|nr:hypothetical protein [Sphingomonas sp. Leaf412]KQT31820.1 hypothetical protein ASG29_07890 [Sphingomonas sp. Leaf412]
MIRYLPLTLLAVLGACDRTPEARNDAVVATPSPAPTPSATAASLDRYVDRYPLDDVAGKSFLAEPRVAALVEGVVPDREVRARVLDRDVTATPIVLRDGRILSHGCEPHNCGAHNWTIAIRPDGAGGAVCYYDQDRNVGRWYPEGAGAPVVDGCPSGDE